MFLLYPSPSENVKLLYRGSVWNKGLTKETDPRVNKQSKSSKGKPKSEKAKQNMKDAWTPERKENASLIAKEFMNRPEERKRISKIVSEANRKRQISEESREKHRKSNIERYKKPEEREKQRKSMQGKHWNLKEENKENMRQAQLKRYSDPLQIEANRQTQLHIFSALDHLCKDKYCVLWTEELREAVRERDNHICQNCGRIWLVRTKRFSPHHIHYNKPNCEPDLILLCNSCNVKANYNKNHWESFYMNKLNDRNLLFWTRNRNKIEEL